MSVGELITRANYCEKKSELLDAVFLASGRIGSGIRLGVKALPSVAPVMNAAKYDMETQFGQQLYLLDLTAHNLLLKEDSADNLKAVGLLILRLSTFSKDAMKADGEYAKAAASTYAYDLYKILDKTHQTCSKRFSHLQLVKLLATPMGDTPFDAFLSREALLWSSIKSNYEDRDHPGYISLDKLRRAVLLINLHPVHFKSVIDKIHDSLPDASTADILQRCSAYVLEHGEACSVAVVAVKGLAAVIPGAAARVTSKYDSVVKRLSCEFCWGKGFDNRSHGVSACPFRLRSTSYGSSLPVAHIAVAAPSAQVSYDESFVAFQLAQ